MKIATCDIQAGGNLRLPMALKAMESMNTDLVLLTEMKLVKDSHTLGGHGCTVCATESKKRRGFVLQGGQILAHQGSKKVWSKCDWGNPGIRELAAKHPWSLHSA
jgi:hypothetical protein